ncbi:MAG: DUF445 family protein [Pseudomonadota bacterium]
MNKSLVTNLLAAMTVAVGYFYPHPLIFSIGLFALSGAITNWLAVHMLFEKVPGLYGSGVVPARFEEFKGAIRTLMMEQFFTSENIQRFLSGGDEQIDLAPVIEKTDLSPAFDGLVKVIQESAFGGMLAMVGGVEALQPLRDPFTNRMKKSLQDISQTDEFKAMLREGITHTSGDSDVRSKIEDMIDKRLNELTPKMVKEIVQKMIRKHLGWLVVWGGVLGGLIGGIASVVTNV